MRPAVEYCDCCGQPIPKRNRDKFYAKERRAILQSLKDNGIPWMWDTELPPNYYRIPIVGSVCFKKKRPTILRGSRYAIEKRLRCYSDGWWNYVFRAARMFRLTVLRDETTKDAETLDRIMARATRIYPRARPRDRRGFFLDGKLVDLPFELNDIIKQAEDILKSLDIIDEAKHDSIRTGKKTGLDKELNRAIGARKRRLAQNDGKHVDGRVAR